MNRSAIAGRRRAALGILTLTFGCTARPVPVTPAGEFDADEDGIADRTEQRTGTDWLHRDTDRDGVTDGDEDLNRDGHVDRPEGETDPRRPGLFPGDYPHIPEPLAFDLVRGLGAREGELEANSLVLVGLDTGRVTWAPEVEWAFADGYAVEFELPMVDRHLEALKLALQGTLPSDRFGHFAHGWQTFAEVSLDNGHTDAVLLYVFGHRLTRSWSYLTMIGARSTASKGGLSDWATVLNSSLFVDVREWWTAGLESNTWLDQHGEWRLRLLPQVHLQLSEHVRIQLGAGAEAQPSGLTPVVGTRFIME